MVVYKCFYSLYLFLGPEPVWLSHEPSPLYSLTSPKQSQYSLGISLRGLPRYFSNISFVFSNLRLWAFTELNTLKLNIFGLNTTIYFFPISTNISSYACSCPRRRIIAFCSWTAKPCVSSSRIRNVCNSLFNVAIFDSTHFRFTATPPLHTTQPI